MKAEPYNIAKVFSDGGAIHYVLPHFQREYRWTQSNWETLLNDALAVYDVLIANPKAKVPEHFLGALVAILDGTTSLSIPVYRVVDGQQRLTTLSLLICAFADLSENNKQAQHLTLKLRSYLFNAHESGEARYKLRPTVKNGDRAAYSALLNGQPLGLHASRIPQAYTFFRAQLTKLLSDSNFQPEAFFRALALAMQVVFIELNAGENAYQIFESLNAKAEPLKQSDLVRNYIAMRLSSHRQEEAFTLHWAPIEQLLDDNRTVGKSSMGELTALLRHTDAMRSGVLPSEKHIYARFRDAMQNYASNEESLISELSTLRRYAGFYDLFLRPDKGEQPKIAAALRRLNALDVTTAYPFLLAVADYMERGVISPAQFVEGCKLLENYLMRRFLAGAPTSYLNKMFAALPRAVNWDNFEPSLRATLAERNYPTDARIREVLPSTLLYSKNNALEKIISLLTRVNDHLYAGSDVIPTLNAPLTVEHILPQNPSAAWADDLGDELESTRYEWTHTLGNLTLVTQSYNSSLSNDSWSEKQEKLVTHGLKLNSDYFAREISTWNASAIRERADWLIEQILEIWPSFGVQASAIKTIAPATPAPHAIVIRGQRFKTKSWRALMRQAAAFVAATDPNWVELHTTMPLLIRQTPFAHAQYDFGNGWYFNINWSAQSSLHYTEQLLEAAGIGKSEWTIEL